MLWRELRIRYEDYFEGGMGAETISRLIDRIDLDVEEVKLREMIDAADGRKPLSAQRRQKVIKRLKIVTAFNRRDENGRRANDPRAMILDSVPVIPPDLRPDGPAGRRSVRHLRPQRPLPAGHQPEQPAEAAARSGCPRDHHQQREAHAAGGGRRPLRQRPPRASGHRAGEPAPQEPVGHAEGEAGSLPPEPAGQAGRLLGTVGHRDRPDPPAPPVRAAQADGPRAVQALRDEAAGRRRVRPEHQVGQAHGRAASSPGVGRARRRDQGAPGPFEPCPHPAPPGHPGLRAGAGRGEGHPGPPAGVHRVQRRLRRRPDGRAPAPVRRGPGRGPGADAVGQQHPLAGHRSPDHRAHPGHGLRHLLPHPPRRRGQGRGPGLPSRLRGRDRLRRRGHRPPGQDRHPSRGGFAPGPVDRPGQGRGAGRGRAT